MSNRNTTNFYNTKDNNAAKHVYNHYDSKTVCFKLILQIYF